MLTCSIYTDTDPASPVVPVIFYPARHGFKAPQRPELGRFLLSGGQINISPAGVTYTPSGVSQVIHVSGSEKLKLVASRMTFTIKAYSI